MKPEKVSGKANPLKLHGITDGVFPLMLPMPGSPPLAHHPPFLTRPRPRWQPNNPSKKPSPCHRLSIPSRTLRLLIPSAILAPPPLILWALYRGLWIALPRCSSKTLPSSPPLSISNPPWARPRIVFGMPNPKHGRPASKRLFWEKAKPGPIPPSFRGRF